LPGHAGGADIYVGASQLAARKVPRPNKRGFQLLVGRADQQDAVA